MKKQFKKSLSVFMAMLMVMSCWVFFAPTAEAISSGSYYYEVIARNTNATGGWDKGDWTLYGKANNGQGSEASIATKSQYINYDGTNVIMSGTTTSFPSKFTFDFSFGGGATSRNAYVTFYLKIGTNANNAVNIPLTLTNSKGGGWITKEDTGNTDNESQYYKLTSGVFNACKGTITCTVNSSAYPYANSVVTASNPTNQTVPRTGTASTSASFYCNDQYGVRLAANVNANNGWTGCTVTGSVSSTGLSLTGPTNTATNSGTNSAYTVNITISAKLAGATNSQTVTIAPTFKFNNKTATGRATFTLTDPKYTHTYNGNGGTVSPTTSGEIFYGSTYSGYPKSGTREGYEFLGLYSTKKADNYDYTKPTIGSGNYTGNYNNNTQVTSDTTWYAAWWAKNVEVEFRTDDNQLISKYTSKYDQKETHVDDATNALIDKGYEVVKGGSFDGTFSGWVVKEAYDINGNDRNLNGSSINDVTLMGKTVFVPEYTYGKNSYNVKFIGPNGNTLNSKTSYQYREEAETPADQSKNTDARYTYKFIGWAVRPEGQLDTSYLVDSNGFTENGDVITTAKNFTVRNDVTYIAVFEKVYREYTVKYVEKNKTTTFTGVHYGDEITEPIPENNFISGDRRWHFIEWKLESGSAALVNGTCRGNATYTAEYYDEEIEYQIRFFDHTSEETNRPINRVTSYKAGSQVTIPTNVLNVYRDESNEYRFIGWDKNPSTVAKADVDYYAVYESFPLYTVNYYNGDELIEGASIQEVAGTDISNKYVGAVPTKDDDKHATNYVFKGWADADGKAVTTLGEQNLDLYAQYDCDVIEYVVEFRNDDGSIISSNTYNYLDEITVPEDPTKAEDDTYTYEFRSWDIDVDPYCEDSVVYTATYRRTYKYYTVEWIDENDTVINTQKYIYNERINPPIAPETNKVSTDPNFTYVFDAWENIETGEKFSRGDRISGNAKYKATYKLEANICTVELYDEDGTTLLQTLKVPYGETDIRSKSTTPIKKSTADEHYNFTGWKNFDGSNFTVVNGDIKLKASYEAAAHRFIPYDVEVAPTFFENGKGIEICENDDCRLTKEVEIEKLEDTIAPTAKLYVKNHTWESNDTEEHDYTNAIPVAPSNMFVINTADNAARSKYNLFGKGSGVATIGYSVQSGEVNPESIADADWNIWYDYDQLPEERKDKEANITAKLSDVIAENEEIENGQKFVIYGKIVDRLGNTTYINSDLLIYDTVAPVVEVTSEHQNNNKHCIDATISVEEADDIESVTLNGTKIELDKNGKATIEKAGLYQVAVIDVAGNETKVNFEIIGTHTSKTYTSAATCTADGFVREVCTLCLTELNSTTLDALGHEWDKGTYTDPDCNNNGYTTIRCTRCGETQVTEDDPPTQTEHNWVENELLRKEPTCTATGIKVSECSICHETLIEEIPVDTENGHIFYRDKQTKDPTCLEMGEVTHECKYCGKVFKVRDVEALGHDDGKWIVTKEPTCIEAGTQELHCTRDDVLLETEEIEALGHSYKAVVTPPTETEEGYTTYTCVRCDDSYVSDHVIPLVKYTILFIDEDGKDFAMFEKLQGETIVASDVDVPTKAADDTYKYTFAGWVDQNGNDVTFPIIVEESDLTLSPKFEKSYVSYTVTLYKEDGSQYNNKIGYLHNDKTPAYVLPTTGPEKASDSTYDYTFIGWSADGTEGGIVESVEKFTSDLEFTAVYSKTLRIYNVVFAYDAENVIKTYKVQAGTDATDLFVAETEDEKPVKAFDGINHYVFTGWRELKTGSLKNIQADTLVFAEFDSFEHNFESQVIQEQTIPCVNEEITKFTCSECGYSYESITKAKTDHVWGEPVDGKVICLNGCGITKDDETTYTVTFLDEDGKTVIKTIDFLKYGEDITSRIPTPTKSADKDFTYEFAGWDKDVVTTVTEDATYTATYTKTARLYKVIFAYDSNNIIKIYNDQPLMDDFTSIYDAETPTKTDRDDYGHYEFIGWSNRGINEELKSIYLEAQFKKVSHNYTSKSTVANCTVGAGTTYTCKDCGYSYTKETSAPLGHVWSVVETVEPTYNTEGYIKYECSRCHEIKTEPLAIKQMITVQINVRDNQGNPIEGARVTLLDIETGAFIASSTTGSDGVAVVRVPEAKKYTITIEAIDLDQIVSTIVVNKDGSTVNGWKDSDINVVHCSCTCHRDGLWAKIFRFFHKIIKLFAGEFKCCNNPDPRYGK